MPGRRDGFSPPTKANKLANLFSVTANSTAMPKKIWVSLMVSYTAGVRLQWFLFLTGIQTSQDARFYALSSKFKPFSSKDQPLVLQFTVKHEQNIDCGGGYAKVFDCGLAQDDMHGDSPYLIMFGK
jgi:hypothetical protein